MTWFPAVHPLAPVAAAAVEVALSCILTVARCRCPLASLPAPAPAASHTDRYEFRCSAGHRMLYHQPCWRKATGAVAVCHPVLAPCWLHVGHAALLEARGTAVGMNAMRSLLYPQPGKQVVDVRCPLAPVPSLPAKALPASLHVHTFLP